MAAERFAPATVRIAAHFEKNLDELETFERERGSTEAFKKLLDQLFGTVIPSPQRFPKVGRDLMARAAGSVRGAVLEDQVRDMIPSGAVVRQYTTTQHVVLYLEQEDEVVVLAIRHHRQLGFDFQFFWDMET